MLNEVFTLFIDFSITLFSSNIKNSIFDDRI